VYKRGHIKFLLVALAIIVIGFGFLTSFDYSEPFDSFKLGVNTLSSSSGDFLTGAAIGLEEEVVSEESPSMGTQEDITPQAPCSSWPCNCGDDITGSITMAGSDLVCTIDGLNVGASNITIDCAGFSIIGNGGAAFSGIKNSPPPGSVYSNVTIKNCVIRNFGTGINFEKSDNSTIWNNTIGHINISEPAGGIFFANSSYANISNNIITNITCGMIDSPYGITYLESPGSPLFGFVISGNNISSIYGNSTILPFGIVIGDPTFNLLDGLKVENNVISDINCVEDGCAPIGGGIGIYVKAGTNINITDNNISSSAVGIIPDVSYLRIIGNRFSSLASVGIGTSFLGSTTKFNHSLIENNTFETCLVSAVDLLEPLYNNTFLNNNFSNNTLNIVDRSTSNNIFVYNNSFGEVKWTISNLTTVGPIDLAIGTNIFVENNTVGLADNVSLANLNTSAQLKFNSLNWTNATAQFCDGENGNPSNCQTCNSTINCSYSNVTGIMLVNVTHFSNYTTNGTNLEPVAETYCGGDYTSGNWVINTTISCSNEVIPVLGYIIIQDASETEVSTFSSSTNSYYDLRGNSTSITFAIPDLIKDESAYTNNWAYGENNEFYILMNESEHGIQIWTDTTGLALYAIDVDDSSTSGEEGPDIIFGYDGKEGIHLFAAYNSTAGESQLLQLGNGFGSQVVDTTWDNNLLRNYTVYWNISGNSTELVIDLTGDWVDKLAVDAEHGKYTTFKNSTVNSEGKGNLTLNNADLSVNGNFTINANTYFNADNSNITFNTPNGNTEFRINEGANVVINNSNMQSNNSYNYSFYVSASDFTLENTFVDNLCSGCGSASGWSGGIVLDGAGGVISNLSVGDNLNYMAICLSGSLALISDNNVSSYNILVKPGGATSNTVRNNYLSNLDVVEAHDNLFSNNTIYGFIAGQDIAHKGYNNTYLNNNLDSAQISDLNNTLYDWFIYNNSFGEIKWYRSNFTTASVDLNIGTNVYVENNTLGLVDNTTLINFNTTAELTFNLLSWTNATAQFCDGENGNPSNCQTCNSTINCSYSNVTGIMLVNVTHFSNYTTNGTNLEPVAETYCGGDYTSGNWVINTTISCSNEVIPVLGYIIIQDASETEVSTFSSSTNSYYDLRGNSTTIASAIPDGDKTTPSQYTDDWDSDANREFYVVMNETENKLHIYAVDNDAGGDFIYSIDVDGSRSTGISGIDDNLDGTEVIVRPTAGIGCWNLSAPGIITLLGSNGGICDNTFNAGITTNTTVYYNQSGNDTETVLNIDGSWGGSIYVAGGYAGEASVAFTTFKNSSLITAGKGNLTLDNVTLSVGGNFTVNDGGILTVNNSNITMNTPDDAVELKFKSGSTTKINHTYIQSNGSYNYSFYVPASDFILENGNIDNLCQFCGSEAGTEGLIMAGTGGTINNMTFGSNMESVAIGVYHATNVLISNNNATSGTGGIIQVLGSGSTGNTISNNLVNSLTTSSGAYSNTYSDNIIYSVLSIGLSSSNDANNTFLNNNLSSLAAIADATNTSVSNYFIYNNSFGEIKWYQSNFTIAGVALEIGTNVYVENNTLGLVDNSSFANFNTSAELKFYGLNWSDATAQFCDGESGNPSSCNTCNSTINCSYSSGTGIMLANVTSFSNYTTNGSTAVAATDNSPNTTLVSPAVSYSNTTTASYNLTFECNATDDNQLQNISLYLTNSTNESFVLNQTTSITGTANSSNWALNLSTGNYTWNCLAFDNASQSDWDTNRSLSLNYTAPLADSYPYWSSKQTAIQAGYSPSKFSYFNITWEDDNSVSTVYFESNYSGTPVNYSMNNLTATVYNYSVILPAGTHYWKSHANDSTDQWNVSAEWDMIIPRASSQAELTLNDSDSNITVNSGTTIDLNCTSISSEGSVYLYSNGTLINSGTSPIGNSTTFSSVGQYNITCSYLQTQNYSAASKIYWVTVLNNLPNVTQPTITPATAYTNDTLTANTTYTDADAAGTVYFLWYVDEVNVYNQTNTTISNGTTVITTLSNSYFNKTHLVNLSVYSNDGTNDSTTSWSSNTITILNLAPTFDSDLTAQTANYGQAFTYDVDCSDADSDTLTYYDNTSLFNINSSTGIITDTPVQGEIGAYTINISCGDGTINTSQTFVYNITDGIAPTVRITAPVSSISATSTLLNATSSENATCYYKNSTASYAAMSTTGNTTHSQNITGLVLGNNLYSVQCNDSSANSATQTTYVLRISVVANDTNTTSLTFVGNSTNTSNILTNLNLTLNISTSLSNVAISSSEFSSNPEQETFAITSYTVTEFKFYTIDAPEIADFINKITLLFSYNETDVLAAGITEASLGVFYYNTATELWVEESEVYVDTTANTIEANVTHLSTFVLGQATVTAEAAAAAASSSSSSGGGSGWGTCGDGVCNDGLTCAPNTETNNDGGACYVDCGLCPLENVVEEVVEEETVAETVTEEGVKEEILSSVMKKATSVTEDFRSFINNNADGFLIAVGAILLLIVFSIVVNKITGRNNAVIVKSSPKKDSQLLKKSVSKGSPRPEAKPLKRYRRVTKGRHKKKVIKKKHSKTKETHKRHTSKKRISKVKHKKK